LLPWRTVTDNIRLPHDNGCGRCTCDYRQDGCAAAIEGPSCDCYPWARPVYSPPSACRSV